MALQRQIAVCMGMHVRLGKNCGMSDFCTEVLQIIVEASRSVLLITRAKNARFYDSVRVPSHIWLCKFMHNIPGSTHTMKKEELHMYLKLKLEILHNKLWHNNTRFYNRGVSKGWRNMFVMYETLFSDITYAEEAIRSIVGEHNYEQYVHVRSMQKGLQIFIFGPDVDTHNVLSSKLFFDHAYFAHDAVSTKMCFLHNSLHNWPPGKCIITQDHLSINFR
jgi:hypothetical protein